jgi:hypothetical protein
MKKYLYITISFFLISSQIVGQDKVKNVTPFYLYYKSSGNLRGITTSIEIKNNGIIKYKVDGVEEKSLTKTIKMDKLSFQVFKAKLVDYYQILELPRENLSCKTCMEGSWVELKFQILNVSRDIAADNPSKTNKIFKELEKYLFDVVGKLDVN